MKNLKNIFLLLFVFQLSAVSLAQTPNFWSLAVFGDAGVTTPPVQALRNSLISQQVNSLFLLGDNLYNTKTQSYSQVWSPWKTSGFNFFAVAIGNHNKSYNEELAFFAMPNEYYSFTENNVRFIILNSDNVRTAKEQAYFLEQTLLQAKEKQIYLAYHHPSVTLTDDHNWPERADFQKLVRPLIAKYQQKITAIFNGHDHIASLVEINGIPLIVSGATHESNRPKVINTNDGLFQIRTLWNYPGGYYWVRLNLATAGTKTCAQFIRVDRPEISLNVQLYPKTNGRVTNCN